MSKRKAEIGDRVLFRTMGDGKSWVWVPGWVRGFGRTWVGKRSVHAYEVDNGAEDDPNTDTNGATVWALCTAAEVRKPGWGQQ